MVLRLRASKMTSASTTSQIQNCLDGIRAGDITARERLIVLCQRRLRLIVRRQLRGFPNVKQWEETSDVFQNVYVRLGRALERLSLTTPRDFLQLAAFHCRLELLDLAKRYEHKAVPGLTVDLAEDDCSDPVTSAKWCEFHEHIAQLPDDERALFDLLYYNGLSQDEAKDLLGTSLATLKRRWQEARIRLKKWLDENFLP